MSLLSDLDKKGFLLVNGWSGSWLDYGLGWTTWLGDNFIALTLIGIFMFIWERNRMLKKYLIFLAGAALVGAEIQGLKFLVERPRPYAFFTEDFLANKVTINCLFKTYISNNSFPSGHAALSFFAAVILNHLYGNKLWVLYPVAFLIALSRIYTGAHFPSDVLAGACLGAGMGFGVRWILRALATNRLFKKVLSEYP